MLSMYQLKSVLHPELGAQAAPSVSGVFSDRRYRPWTEPGP